MSIAPTTLVVPGLPALGPALVRGVLGGIGRRRGAQAPDVRLVVRDVRADPVRLAAYEKVCGFPAGTGTLPLTYPHVLAFPLAMRLMARRDFPLPLLGLVHTSFAVSRHRDVFAGEPLELAVGATGLRPHRRGTEVTVVTEARAGDGPVWSSESTYLARHATPADGDAPAATGRDTADAAARLPVRAEWEVAGDLGRRYGAASGDRNPIHLFPLTARLFGFPRAIAHGMWSVARCLAETGVAPGAVHARADFRAPVLLPGRVTYAAEGTGFALLGGADGARVHLTGTVRPL